MLCCTPGHGNSGIPIILDLTTDFTIFIILIVGIIILYRAVFLKDVMEPRKTSGNIPAPKEHEDDDSTAGTQSQEAGPSTVEEEALSVDPDLDTIFTHSETAEKPFCRKRNRGNTKYNHQQEMLNLEREKFEWIRQQEDRQVCCYCKVIVIAYQLWNMTSSA
jgi:hypothetical protein